MIRVKRRSFPEILPSVILFLILLLSPYFCRAQESSGILPEDASSVLKARDAFQERVDAFFFSQVTDEPPCSLHWKLAQAALQKLGEKDGNLEGPQREKKKGPITLYPEASVQHYPIANGTGCGLVKIKRLTVEQAYHVAEKKATADIVHHAISDLFKDHAQPAYRSYYQNRNEILAGPFPFLSDIDIRRRKTWKKAVEVRLSATYDKNKLKAFLLQWNIDPDHPERIPLSSYYGIFNRRGSLENILEGTGTACNDYVWVEQE